MPRILVVDDSPTMRKMIMAALRPLKGEFGEAGNGLEAIEQLALARYDAMTLDLNMPDMHGLEVLRYVRQLVTTCRSLSSARAATKTACSKPCNWAPTATW